MKGYSEFIAAFAKFAAIRILYQQGEITKNPAD
jgi:hypothetical protein